jgi:hypothetical protein
MIDRRQQQMADLLDQLELLDWLPGETLFSLVSRLHRFWGYSQAGQTCKVLFGHPQQGSQHDLPGRLSTFVSRTNGRYGGAPELAMTRTVLAYYRPFLSDDVMDSAVRTMSADSVAHLKLKLGILTSRFRANHPLKACPHCLREDVAKHGWSYWHLAHQHPGVWVCLAHVCWLQVSSLKATGVGRFQWVLPSHADLRAQGESMGQGCTRDVSAAQGMAQLVSDLVDGRGGPYSIDILELAYQSRLSDMGWVTSGGSLRWPEIGRHYAHHIQSLRGCVDIPADMADPGKAAVQLGRIFRGARTGTHPLRHLLIIQWLFGDSHRFLAAMEQIGVPSRVALGVGESAQHATNGGNLVIQQLRLKELVTSAEFTITGAARYLGVDVATAMSWAAKMRMSVPRRPKLLKDEVRSMAIEMLRSGADKGDVALRAGVSIQTVTRLLLTEVDLHHRWREARFQALLRRHRSTWISLVEAHGAAGTKILRAMEPVTYAWLYRNDHAWLVDHKPNPLSHRPSCRSQRVDWDARDHALSDQVRAVAYRLSQQLNGQRIKLWQIYQELPELKAKLGSLERLPLTRKALALLVSARSPSKAGSLLD